MIYKNFSEVEKSATDAMWAKIYGVAQNKAELVGKTINYKLRPFHSSDSLTINFYCRCGAKIAVSIEEACN